MPSFLEHELGFGYDGIVFSTDCQSAVKTLRFKALFEKSATFTSVYRNAVSIECLA